MKVPGCIEMSAVVGGELHLLDRPALPIRQILRLQPFEELQHARQALLVIDVLDRGMASRRIGGHVVLQRHRNIDQSSGHGRFLGEFLLYLIGAFEAPPSWRSTLFFKTPIFSTSSSIVSPCSRNQPSLCSQLFPLSL